MAALPKKHKLANKAKKASRWILPLVCWALLSCATTSRHGRGTSSVLNADTNILQQSFDKAYDDESMRLTKILFGQVPWPVGEEGIQFRPGTLHTGPLETAHHCHFHETYHNHINAKSGVHVSEQHGLLYWGISKAGSSSARQLMKDQFGATHTYTHPANFSAFYKFTFVRDPVDRFFSGYHEMWLRDKPWRTCRNNKPCQGGCSKAYPFLFEGIHSNHEFMGIRCPHLAPKDRRSCASHMSHENGTLTARFKRFVTAYNGLAPCNPHLGLQLPKISQPNGSLWPLDEIYTLEQAPAVWQRLASERGVHLSQGTVAAKARASTAHFDYTRVGNATLHRICHLTALDYCCLNLRLPEVCRDAGVYCTMYADDRGRPRISPWTPLLDFSSG